ncbi:Mediator of RNA polymerase II transcription subunit 23 [Halotydeus destructor]|nr:Mediator of RNA polymerase II transcription subunit 23 [Halotydeus destructor]
MTDALTNKFLDLVLRTETIEQTFVGFIIPSKENDDFKIDNYMDQFTELIKKSTELEALDQMIKQYVAFTGGLFGQKQVDMLLNVLELAIQRNLLTAKLVGEALLVSEKLTVDNDVFWCGTFNLLFRIMSSADYKGVRDLLKIMLDKVQSIPENSNVSMLAQLNVIYKVFDLIMDRNASLLPAYLVLDEIQKKSYPQGRWPHWKFAKLLSSFIDSFRPTAQMVTIAGRSKLMPVVGYSSTLGNAWKLDPHFAKFQLKGLLPYKKELVQQQTTILRYVIEQPYSKDMVCAMLGLSNKLKQRCPILEEQLVELIMIAMERSETVEDLSDTSEQGSNPILFLWQHLSSHLIYFVLFHHASFPHVVESLILSLSEKNYRKGREHLMWVLLQFISGAIQKNPLVDFLPIMKLYDLLYPEKEALPLPDVSKPLSTHAMAVSSIWIHLMKKAEVEPVKLQRMLPAALSQHVEFLQQNLGNAALSTTFLSDYKISLLCNAFSTNQESFARPMAALVEAVQGRSNAAGNANILPLSMDLLDSLTVHTKMSLIHNIVTQIMKLAQSRTPVSLSPSLVETYSRLLIYTEIESLGIKGFMQQLLTTVFKSQAWGILHTLLEMFVYRLHHIPAHYRVQLLGQLHTLSNVQQTNQIQLQLCMESTALKLILGLSSAEVLAIPQFSRFNEPKGLISVESEELNKVLVLTLARAIHVTGSGTLSAAWCKELLTNIMQSTPLTWSSFTLMCFPPVIAEYFNSCNAHNRENKDQLKRSVDEEFRKWKAMNSENDIISHFSGQNAPPLFLCLIWRMVLENDYRLNPIVYKILDKIGARGLSIHLRTFCDYIVNELAISSGGSDVKKYMEALNDLIWKCNIITLDKVLLCLTLRAYEGSHAQVSLLICMLILDKEEFTKRVEDFVQENSPEHWKHSDWHERHLRYQAKYPEKFYFENLSDIGQGSQHSYLPVYFSNVCLRFLPVMDIIIHRFLELVPVSLSIDKILDKLGCLYKFHDRPITYLYNTLHYYEQKLKDKPQLKRKLVVSIIGAFGEVRPVDWAMSETYKTYMQKANEDISWNDELDYYIKLVGRFVDTLNSTSAFPHFDWRFNEFPNACAHALHVTCIELMALPVSASAIANNLLNVILVGHKVVTKETIESWMNAIGLILTALPDSYWSVLMDKIVETLQSPILAKAGQIKEPFELMDFCSNIGSSNEVQLGYVIGLSHAVWHHASVGQISLLPTFLKDRVKPIIKTEDQFLFVCHLVGPFLQRFYVERTRIVMDVTIELYEMLGIVDRQVEKLRFIDAICDLLYHIKYMFTGDSVKNEVEAIIRNLRPQMQLRLRFITHLTIEEASQSNQAY